MKKLINLILLGFFALSCINPQNAANKAKSVKVMADQIAVKFPAAAQVTIEDYLSWTKVPSAKVVLVDVRPLKERKISMLPGAISIDQFKENKSQYKNYKIVAYCTIGHRSSQFAIKWSKKNYSTYNLKESLLGWAHRGLTFIKGGKETKRAHVYEEAWNFLPKGYKGVTD